jgi:hypothetical protein
MNVQMQKKALAARDAHMALLELKRLVDAAAETTHAAEFEAIQLAISSSESAKVTTTLQVVMDQLKSANFDTALSQALEKLEAATH